jgi:hypothetical protein
MTRVFVPLLAVAALTFASCSQGPQYAIQTVAGPEVPAGEWFQQTGCTACHSISAYRIWNVAAQGPDLSLAVEDVPRRFGTSLDQFLHAPTGTMAMVLATRIPLTPEQRDVAIAKLKEVYRTHLEATGARPVASH